MSWRRRSATDHQCSDTESESELQQSSVQETASDAVSYLSLSSTSSSCSQLSRLSSCSLQSQNLQKSEEVQDSSPLSAESHIQSSDRSSISSDSSSGSDKSNDSGFSSVKTSPLTHLRTSSCHIILKCPDETIKEKRTSQVSSKTFLSLTENNKNPFVSVTPTAYTVPMIQPVPSSAVINICQNDLNMENESSFSEIVCSSVSNVPNNISVNKDSSCSNISVNVEPDRNVSIKSQVDRPDSPKLLQRTVITIPPSGPSIIASVHPPLEVPETPSPTSVSYITRTQVSSDDVSSSSNESTFVKNSESSFISTNEAEKQLQQAIKELQSLTLSCVSINR